MKYNDTAEIVVMNCSLLSYINLLATTLCFLRLFNSMLEFKIVVVVILKILKQYVSLSYFLLLLHSLNLLVSLHICVRIKL